MKRIDDPETLEAVHMLLGLRENDKITSITPTRLKVVVESDYGTYEGVFGQLQHTDTNVYDVELSRRPKT